jgi:hypothetical protein
MTRTCAGCGKPMGPKSVEDGRLEVRTAEGGNDLFCNAACFDWELIEDAHELSGALLPFSQQLRLACEARLRETQAPTFARACHDASFPSL